MKCKFEGIDGYCMIYIDEIDMRDIKCNPIEHKYCIYFKEE
jgi:hypothetical protein